MWPFGTQVKERPMIRGLLLDSGAVLVVSRNVKNLLVKDCRYTMDGNTLREAAMKMTLADRFWTELQLMGELHGVREPDSKYLNIDISSKEEEGR